MSPIDVRISGLILAAGWGSTIFFLGIFSLLTNKASRFIHDCGMIYIGYRATFPGSLLGACWGFLDGFISGIILGWIYNLFAAS